MKRIINIAVALILTTGFAVAQEMFVTSGSAGKSDKASLSWVVGGGISQGQIEAAPVCVSEVIAKEQKATKVNQVAVSFDVKVYPNPVTERINIMSKSEELMGGKAVLTDMSGKKVMVQDITSQNTQLAVASLSTGMYMVNVIDKYGKYSESIKVVKK